MGCKPEYSRCHDNDRCSGDGRNGDVTAFFWGRMMTNELMMQVDGNPCRGCVSNFLDDQDREGRDWDQEDDLLPWYEVYPDVAAQAVAPGREPGVPQRIRLVWNAHQPPRCFDSRIQWREWFALRSGVYSPCVDCTPDFRARMGAMYRCERPEVIFVRDTRTDEVFGLSGEDPHYARVLLGLALAPGMEIIGRTVEYTEVWQRLLKMVRRRAHRDVQWAIDVWQKRYRSCRAAGNREENTGAEQ